MRSRLVIVVLVLVVLATLVEPLRRKKGGCRWGSGGAKAVGGDGPCEGGIASNVVRIQQEWQRLSEHDGAGLTNATQMQMIQLFGLSYVGIAGMIGVLTAVCVGHFVADDDVSTPSGAFVYWLDTPYTDRLRSVALAEHRERSYVFLYTVEAF